MARRTAIAAQVTGPQVISTILDFDDEAGTFGSREVITVSSGAKFGGDYVMRTLTSQVRAAIRRAKHDDVVGIGVATVGEVDAAMGRILADRVIRGWSGMELKARLEEACELPVRVVNAAEAHAYGEAHWGTGRGAGKVLVADIGAEASMAVASDDGIELLPVGDLASVASTGGIVANYIERGGDRVYHHDKRRPWGYAMTLVEVDRRAHEDDDERAIACLEDAGHALGEKITAACKGKDIAKVVVSGAVAECGPILLDAAHKRAQVSIEPSSLGRHAALIGAVAGL